MADIKFSEFPKATESKNTDEIAILQDGVNKTIKSPILESKILNRTVQELSKEGGISLNLVNLKGIVTDLVDLDNIVNPEINDAYQVTNNDNLISVWNGTQWVNGFTIFEEPTGIVEQGNTQAVSGGEVYDNIFPLNNNALTYKYIGNNNALKFTELIKNIFIQTDRGNITVQYIGVNDASFRKLLIMLKSGDKLASFILNADDIRSLKGQIIELIKKEEDILFRESTRVWVEFNEVDFPTLAEFSFLQSHPNIQFYKNAFNYNEVSNTYKLNVSSVTNASLNEFYKLVENIYIVSENSDINENNFTFNYGFINQYAGARKLLLVFEYDSKVLIFYTTQNIVSGSKRVKLEVKENEALNGYECFVDFKDFGNYTTNEYVFYGGLKLQSSAFENEVLLTAQKVEVLESEIGLISKRTTIVNVSKEIGGNNAVQLAINNITDATASNRYKIEVSSGIYEIHKKEDFIGNPGYPAMICPKNHVDIIGKDVDSTIFSADFDESVGESTWMYQTIYNWANDVTISNITFVAKNLRYVLHQDNAQEANGTRYYDNVKFVFLGNSGGHRALGMGTFSGSKTYFTNCISESQVFASYSVHNNINFSKPSLHSFKNHTFSVLNSGTNMFVYNSGSNQPCEIYLENCSFGGSFVLHYEEYWLYQQNVNDHFNHANWVVKGVNNQPFYFKNTVIGSTLCIETLLKNKDSKVRFDTSSTAYDLIIKNRINYFGNLANPNRKIKDGYVIQDGANGVSAFAFGGKSILEQYYFPDGATWTTRQDGLGIRLGDCSTTNKILGIIINGTTYNIVFNKNYTAFTNAQVIAEINAVIGSVATAKEYNIGADYYAEMTDVISVEINNSTTSIIPKGTIVSKVGSRIKPCEENEIPYGMLIDDLGAYELTTQGVVTSKARVIKNCYISLDTGNVSSALYSGSGIRYKIVNGILTADVNGNYIVENSKYILI